MYSYNKLGIVHCKYMYLGVSGYNFKKCIILSEDLLYLYKQSTDPDEIQHFIWVSTVCKSTFFASQIHRDNIYKNTQLKIKHFIKKIEYSNKHLQCSNE